MVSQTQPDDDAALVLALHEEVATVSARRVYGETVSVQVRTEEHGHRVEQALSAEQVEVERIAIGRPVSARPPVREEGDVTIVSVVEEVLVVERRLILKEEIHLRRVRSTSVHTETVALRRQVATIDRLRAGDLSLDHTAVTTEPPTPHQAGSQPSIIRETSS